MSMNTYPFEEKYAFCFDGIAAATALVADYLRSVKEIGVTEDPVAAKLAEAFCNKAVTAYAIASDPKYKDWIGELDLDSISDAHDLLSDTDVDNVLHCCEFTGTAEPSARFAIYDGKSVSFDDDFALFVVPAKNADLFSAAYKSPDELLEEYRTALLPVLGEDFPYGARIMDVSGTYVC